MEKGVVPSAIFGGVAIVLLSRVFLGWINDVSYPEGPLMVQARAALDDSTEIVTMGSSPIYFGIRPTLFEHRLMNITGPNFDYTCLEVVLPHNIDRFPNARLVLIEFEPHIFCNNSLEKWMNRNDFRLFWAWGASTRDLVRANDRLDLFDRWEIPVRGTFVAVGSPWRMTPRFYSEWSKAQRRFASGWAIEPGYLLAQGGFHPPEDRPPRASHYDNDWERRIRRNSMAFRSMIHDCRQRGHDIVLLRMPKHPKWSHYFGEENADIAKHHPTLLEDELKAVGVHREDFWDLQAESGWTEDDFIDYVHPNEVGSKKVAERLNARLRDYFEAKH